MGYASRSGRAQTSSSSPRAHAICDRCGFRYNFSDLRWQSEWRGPVLQNIKILVCSPCLDRPQENIRSIVLPADPMPVMNARVQDFETAETDFVTISAPTVYDSVTGIPIPGTTEIATQAGDNLTTSVSIMPLGLEPGGIMPLKDLHPYGVVLAVLSVTANGTRTLTVTCSAVHNLQTNYQVSISGVELAEANGFFSVTVLSPTAFTYQVPVDVPAGNLYLVG